MSWVLISTISLLTIWHCLQQLVYWQFDIASPDDSTTTEQIRTAFQNYSSLICVITIIMTIIIVTIIIKTAKTFPAWGFFSFPKIHFCQQHSPFPPSPDTIFVKIFTWLQLWNLRRNTGILGVFLFEKILQMFLRLIECFKICLRSFFSTGFEISTLLLIIVITFTTIIIITIPLLTKTTCHGHSLTSASWPPMILVTGLLLARPHLQPGPGKFLRDWYQLSPTTSH